MGCGQAKERRDSKWLAAFPPSVLSMPPPAVHLPDADARLLRFAAPLVPPWRVNAASPLRGSPPASPAGADAVRPPIFPHDAARRVAAVAAVELVARRYGAGSALPPDVAHAAVSMLRLPLEWLVCPPPPGEAPTGHNWVLVHRSRALVVNVPPGGNGWVTLWWGNHPWMWYSAISPPRQIAGTFTKVVGAEAASIIFPSGDADAEAVRLDGTAVAAAHPTTEAATAAAAEAGRMHAASPVSLSSGSPSDGVRAIAAASARPLVVPAARRVRPGGESGPRLQPLTTATVLPQHVRWLTMAPDGTVRIQVFDNAPENLLILGPGWVSREPGGLRTSVGVTRDDAVEFESNSASDSDLGV